jgi:hypothetical protein
MRVLIGVLVSLLAVSPACGQVSEATRARLLRQEVTRQAVQREAEEKEAELLKDETPKAVEVDGQAVKMFVIHKKKVAGKLVKVSPTFVWLEVKDGKTIPYRRTLFPTTQQKWIAAQEQKATEK